MNETEERQGSSVSATRARIGQPGMTRRQLLAGAGQAALLAALPVGCVPVGNYPWADGTFWDDGLGWAD